MTGGVAICCVGIGGWYPKGVARLLQKFAEVDPGRTVMTWVNVLPYGAPESVVEDGWSYTGYCAKPFALRAAREAGADIGILCDAAFFPIRPIDPLVEHITKAGFYLCRNGFQLGEWCSDRALQTFGMTRDEVMEIPEVSSYCVGLNFRHDVCNQALDEWCRQAADGVTFPGPHSQMGRENGRNPGHVSHDPRVRGHRHDQTSLTAITWKLGMRELIARPRFTAYLAGWGGHADETTVLLNEGLG